MTPQRAGLCCTESGKAGLSFRFLLLKTATLGARLLPGLSGMAESFVNTFTRHCVSRMDLSDAQIVVAQLPAASEHFNEVQPHSSVNTRSPKGLQAATGRAATPSSGR